METDNDSLFGATEIYLNGQKIGFTDSIEIPEYNNDSRLFEPKYGEYSFSGSIEINKEILEYLSDMSNISGKYIVSKIEHDDIYLLRSDSKELRLTNDPELTTLLNIGDIVEIP